MIRGGGGLDLGHQWTVIDWADLGYMEGGVDAEGSGEAETDRQWVNNFGNRIRTHKPWS